MTVLPAELVPSVQGLGTPGVESLSGYCARLSANIAVPASVVVKRALDGVVHDRTPRSQYNVVVNTRAGTMNGGGSLAREVGEGVGRLVPQAKDDLHRLSFLAFVERFGFSDRDLLSRHRRWCSKCWEADGDSPYERKVWWLAVVDACHVHWCLLDFRCPTCGQMQPALPRGVRLHVCSHCGHDLLTDSVPLGEGRAAERLLWYAREGALLVHAGEAASLVGGWDESMGPAGAYPELGRRAAERGLPSVERYFLEGVNERGGVQLEKLMSALWRLEVGVLELFAEPVRVALVRAETSEA